MAYELTLEPDTDRGGHRYRAELTGDADAAAIRELSDWLDDARLNPDARFELALATTRRLGTAERSALDDLLERHRELREERRLTVIEPPAPHRAAKSRRTRLTTVERAIMVASSGVRF
jgi:hypothetical protein